MVDLGLSVKWAKYNIGAEPGSTKKSYYGDYYAWGETETKENYIWNTYKFGRSSSLTKYNGSDGKKVLEAVDDVATYVYGSNYRMPTKAECEELLALPNQLVTNYNDISGLNGCVFTGTNGNTLFIPAAGYFLGSTHSNAGSICYLWSSSLYSDRPDFGWGIGFYSGSILMYYDLRRCLGPSVRCVSTD